MITPAIEVSGLTKTFGRTRALDGVDLTLTGGRIVGLLGENGCGKTTLLKILAGVLGEYSGEVRIAGHHPGPESKALVSFMPDLSFLPRSWRGTDCLNAYRDLFADFDLDKAQELVGHFGLDPHLRLKEMSKGMQEKIQLALTMSRRAAVFLLDEPLSGVDPVARQVTLDAIVRGLDDHALMFVSTHLVHDLEPVMDAVVMMRHGKILLTRDVDDLRAETSSSIDQLFKEVYR